MNATSPFLELLTGAACLPHPGDAALSIGARFRGRTLVVIGGGGTGIGWTQRVGVTRQELPATSGPRSACFKRSSPEWAEHLRSEALATSGWAVLLIEQQWQAAFGATSSASLGGTGVERMLRVRDAVPDFGDDRLSEDAIRASIDHPTMEGAVIVGVRRGVLEPLLREAEGSGFQVAAVRIGVACLLERHLGQLQKQRQPPERTLVAFDGQSALVVGVREGGFDASEGGLSYLVNRAPGDVRGQIAKRIRNAAGSPGRSENVDILGSELSLEPGPADEAIAIRHLPAEVVTAAVDETVRHDLRPDLRELRRALPRWVRTACVAALLAGMVALIGTAVQAAEALHLRQSAAAARAEKQVEDASAGVAQRRAEALNQESARAQDLAEWVDRNFHAQALIHGFIAALPVGVSLDAVSVQAAEGLPQAKLRFTLVGSEEAQRAALRSVEAAVYQLGYEVGRRDDPTPATTRREGVVYAWDLITPDFSS